VIIFTGYCQSGIIILCGGIMTRGETQREEIKTATESRSKASLSVAAEII